MERIAEIQKMYKVEEKSLRQIAAEMGCDFRTAQKYAYLDNFNIKIPVKQNRGKKIAPFTDLIDYLLEEDLKEHPKQRHTAKAIYRRLKREYPCEFNVSSRSVRTYVAEKKKEFEMTKKNNQCFIPLDHEPGTAQADFGEAYFIENGIRQKGHFLNLSFPYSNAGFCQLFKSENQECILQGLKNIFEYISGVPVSITFDNTKAIVKKIKSYGNRDLTEFFLRFQNHYEFDGIFCNPGKGNEKGSVECKVGYHRRNMLVPVPKFDSIEEFNKYLLEECLKDMERLHYKKDILISDLFKEDIIALKMLPKDPFDVFKLKKAIVNRYGKIKYETKTYSASPDFAQKEVWVKASSDEIEILDEDKNLIQKHKRLYGQQTESMKWEPYVGLIAKRPTSLKYTNFFKGLPQTIQEYFTELEYQEKKKALKLLDNMITETDLDTAVTGFSLALEEGIKDIDSIKGTFHTLTHQPVIANDLETIAPEIPNIIPFDINMKKYDLLMKGGEKQCNKG
jgi:transposase